MMDATKGRKMKVDINAKKEVFISEMMKSGAPREQAESMWNSVSEIASKMTNTKKEHTLSLEECYVLIEALIVTKMTGVGTFVGNDLIHKLSVFLNENKVSPPNEFDVEDLIMSATESSISKIDAMLDQQKHSSHQNDNSFPVKKKNKSYLN
jgi:hypothetical protein